MLSSRPLAPVLGISRRPLLLHDDALSATAASTDAIVVHVEVTIGRAARTITAAGCVGRHVLVEAANFTDDIVKSIVNIGARLGRGFDELAAKVSSERFSLYAD